MRIHRLALAGLVVALAVPSARANLTGTYTGSFKCKWTNNDGTKDKESTKSSTLKIIHRPDNSIQVDIDETPYCGRVIETKPDKKGVAVFVVVGTDGNPYNYNELEYVTWKTTGKARVKKHGFWVDLTTIGECRGGWSRQNEDTPVGNFAFCPGPPF